MSLVLEEAHSRLRTCFSVVVPVMSNERFLCLMDLWRAKDFEYVMEAQEAVLFRSHTRQCPLL